MNHHRPPFPRLLISFVNLPGPYGALDVTARDAHTVELALADGDFVAFRKEQWAALRAAIDPLFGFDVETVVVATDAAGEPLVVEEREPVVARRRRPARKPRMGA
jgi:hypothetical protein